MRPIKAHPEQPPGLSMVHSLLHPQPYRLKRRFSTLFADDPFDNSDQQPISKQACLESSDPVWSWLRTLSTHESPHISPPSRAKSAPNMQSRASFPSPSPPPASPSLPSTFAPPTPSSGSFYAESNASQSTASKASKVENPLYRSTYLAGNDVFLLPSNQPLPPQLDPLLQQVRASRSSPQPSLEYYRNDEDLIGLETGTGESDVKSYMQKEVFIVPPPTKRSDKKRMFQRVVPHNPATLLRLSIPTPDSGYGYNRDDAFAAYRIQLINMGNEMVANVDDLIYPFLAVEFKSDGPFKGPGLWVATNQCLGGGSTYVSIAETLNARLRECRSSEVQRINSAAFSIAMNGTEARLFVSWKSDDYKYYTQKLESYLLQRPEDFVTFRRHVWNIIDWGRTERLTNIQQALDALLEAGRLDASAKAKSPPPPTDDI